MKFTENEILNSPNEMFSCEVGLPDYICVRLCKFSLATFSERISRLIDIKGLK